MAKLVWDAAGSHYYENGVTNGVLYVLDSTSSSKPYPKGVVWNGLTAVTESPDGAEVNDLYADDIKYASMRSAETFGATIEAYTYPDEFAECDGTAYLSTGLSIGQQPRKVFGFVYKTKIGNDSFTLSDDGYKIHIIYNATCSPSERSYETINDSPDAITFSWEIDTTPIAMTGYKPVSTLTVDSLKASEKGLKALEDALFGTESAEAYLPLPDEVVTLLATA